MVVEWDAGKARLNARKHGVEFADAVSALEDERALTERDLFSDEEERWVTLGLDAFGRVLVVVYTWRGESLRLISARNATKVNAGYTRSPMKREYDFSKAKRGPVIQVPKGKARITIRLDEDVIAWFRNQVEQAGGGNYQTLMNDALRQYIARSREPLEETLRRVIREEMKRAS
jgi:uncharacterized DUF497 family protein